MWNDPIKKRKNYYVKIKDFGLIINLDETNPFEIDKCKAGNVASVSKALALFNCNLGG